MSNQAKKQAELALIKISHDGFGGLQFNLNLKLTTETLAEIQEALKIINVPEINDICTNGTIETISMNLAGYKNAETKKPPAILLTEVIII